MTVGHGDARLDAVLADCALEQIEVHAGLRVGRNLDDLHVHRGGALEYAEEGRTLNRDQVTRLSSCPQTEINGL